MKTAIAFALLLCTTSAFAIDPQLQKAIDRGAELFQHETFGGPGRVCESCHLGGGRRAGQTPDGKPMPSLTNAAAVFPRFADGMLFTLSDQVHMCIQYAVKGKPPEFGSEEFNSLVAYVTSLSQGKKIDMGADPR